MNMLGKQLHKTTIDLQSAQQINFFERFILLDKMTIKMKQPIKKSASFSSFTFISKNSPSSRLNKVLLRVIYAVLVISLAAIAGEMARQNTLKYYQQTMIPILWLPFEVFLTLIQMKIFYAVLLLFLLSLAVYKLVLHFLAISCRVPERRAKFYL